MECPYCHAPMEKGYIESGRGRLAWTPEGCKPPLLFPLVLGKSLLIGDNFGGPLLGDVATAYLCRNCEKIVIDIEGYFEE